MVDNLRQVKGQYAALKQVLQDISKELKTEPLSALECIKKLPKAQDMADPQARVDCLQKKNAEFKTQVEDQEAQLKEAKELKKRMKAIEVELAATPGRNGTRQQ